MSELKLAEFGKYNANLSGKMVQRDGEIHVVVGESTLFYPMAPELQPKLLTER